MRRILLIVGTLVFAAGTFEVAKAAGSSAGEIDFEPVSYPATALPKGYHVYRDSASWNEGFVPYWPNPYSSPPQPDFEDSLIVALSYGMTACYETGGGIEEVTREGELATVSLGHVYGLMPMCLAEMPRVLYYRIAKADVPDEVEIAFDEAELPYDLDPREWYPLVIGNAWHFQQGSLEWVETVAATTEFGGHTWHRVSIPYCSEDPCPVTDGRYLRWTEDHYLLLAHAPSEDEPADTLHATTPRSIFTVNVPWDNSLTATTGPVSASTWIYQGVPFEGQFGLDAAIGTPNEREDATYLYGIGPMERLVAALIDGEDFEDTSQIRMALSAPPDPPQREAAVIDVYPHPANRNAVIAYTPQHSGTVRLMIYNMLGHVVAQVGARMDAGAAWHFPLSATEGMTAGFYVVRVIGSDGSTTARSMIVVE